MVLDFGEVILIRMPFHQAGGGKIRPAVVLIDAGDDDFVAAPITSQERRSEFDLALANWRNAGLNVPSWIRVHKLSVLPTSGFLRRLGRLESTDELALKTTLRRAFGV
jgi:mRNA interferase MazF